MFRRVDCIDSRSSQARKIHRRFPLHPVATATSVRIREGKRHVIDGPFAETREQLGGFFLIEATDLDDAISIAARIPGAKKGTVEIRPVVELAGIPVN